MLSFSSTALTTSVEETLFQDDKFIFVDIVEKVAISMAASDTFGCLTLESVALANIRRAQFGFCFF